MLSYQKAREYVSSLVATAGKGCIQAAANRAGHDRRVIVTVSGAMFDCDGLSVQPVTIASYVAIAEYMAKWEFPFNAVTQHHFPTGC